MQYSIHVVISSAVVVKIMKMRLIISEESVAIGELKMMLVPIVRLNSSDIFRSYFKAGRFRERGRSMSFNKVGTGKTKPTSTIHYKYINSELRQYTRYDRYDYHS